MSKGDLLSRRHDMSRPLASIIAMAYTCLRFAVIGIAQSGTARLILLNSTVGTVGMYVTSHDHTRLRVMVNQVGLWAA